jgi:hypothetical protein
MRKLRRQRRSGGCDGLGGTWGYPSSVVVCLGYRAMKKGREGIEFTTKTQADYASEMRACAQEIEAHQINRFLDWSAECDNPTAKTQSDIDRAYRARQQALGIVRKTVRVPAKRWVELQAIVAKMREEAK